MKKQFFSKLLMAAMFVTAVGSFQSCKDYDGDISALQQNVTALQGQKDALSKALSEAQSQLTAAKAAADKAVADAKAAAESGADANEIAKKAQAAVDELAKSAALKSEVESLKSTIAGVQDLIDGKVSKAEYDNAVANLAGQISAIDTKLLTLSNELTDVKSIAEDAAQAKIAVAAMRADLDGQIATLASFKKDVEEQLAGVKELLSDGTIGNVIENLDTKMTAAQEAIDALQGRIAQIDANTQSISEVKTSLESLDAYVKNTMEKVDNVNSSITTLNVFIDTALTSLVLKPTLYYGGIEAVEAIHGMYQPLGFSIYYQDEYTPSNGHTDGTSKVAYDRTTGNAWDITYEYNAKDDLIYKYPIIDAYYHVNPKYVSVENIGDLALNTEDRHYVNTGNTRAERNSLSRQLDIFGPRVYSYEGDGLLHTYFTNNADMWHSVEQYAHTVTVVSLEANAPASEGTRTVTSDWAAIARVHQNNYRIADNDAYILHYDTYPHIYKPEDTDCGMMDTEQYTWTEQHGENTAYERDIVHVYRQAREAIVNEYTHLLKWDGTPVDLDKVIEVHADHHYYDAINNRSFDFPVDLEKLGFERKYTVVNYQYPASMGININGTEESQHAHIEDGHLLKANFITNGKRDLTKEPSRSSIGREPLVMIEIIDNNDVMTWNPDHMNWTADSVANNPRPNLVAVGFIKFKIVDQTPEQILGVQIESQNSHMYASCAGDTVLTNWYEVEEQILDAIKKNGQSISKAEFESNYVLRNVNGTEYPFRELVSATGYINGQVFVPQTNHTSICGTRQNWVAGVDLTKPANWVLPQVVLNEDRIEPGFVDPDRYGRIVYTNYDWLHRETNLIGVAFTAEEMLQQLVKRDHLGVYLDSLGNKVAYLSEADFFPYVDTKVAAKLVDPNHNGWPEVTLTFNVRVHLNKATMNRPAKEGTGWGGWYKVGGSELKYVNANIDAFWNGATGTGTAPVVSYPYDVRRFILNLQQELKGQQWLASSSSYTRAFDFFYNEITGTRAAERIGIQRAKLGELHGDLYFFTKYWLGDLEEGTPYWHDANNTPTVADDKFYADKYLIKVCYTKNPLDTVVWAQEARGSRHIGKLGKYLFAYKYIEDWKNAEKYDAVPKNTDPLNPAQALEQNYSHYDMAHGELIAWIDNYDSHQVDANPNQPIKFTNFDINGRLNENVNVHLNYNSRYAQDLLNRAGRYAEKNAGTLDGYSKEGDNPFSVNVHLNLFEGDCVLAVNPSATEVKPGQDFLFRNDYVENYLQTGGSDIHRADATVYVPANGWVLPDSYEFHTFFHRPAGVPVMLSNPDFIIRFERPISVEFKTPWQNASINAVDDAIAGAATATITYKDLFRDQSGSPYSRIFPMDWRNYTQVKNQTEWIQFYQGKNTGSWNIWNDHSNTRPYGFNGLMPILGFKYMDQDRSSYDRGSNLKFFNWNNGWFYQPNTSDTYADTWNSMNVVPQVDHMLINFGGDEGFYSDNASQINLQITHQTDPATGNIVSTTFKYLNDNYNRGTFDIVIPVTVKYAWGDITTTGRWQSTTNLQRTKDNYYHNDNMNYVKVHFGATIGN